MFAYYGHRLNYFNKKKYLETAFTLPEIIISINSVTITENKYAVIKITNG